MLKEENVPRKIIVVKSVKLELTLEYRQTAQLPPLTPRLKKDQNVRESKGKRIKCKVCNKCTTRLWLGCEKTGCKYWVHMHWHCAQEQRSVRGHSF